LAVHGSEHFGDASIMLASCLKEKGSIDRAIECLEQALADHRCEGEKGTSIRYELGMLYEAACRWEEAEKTFSAIPTFLDVPMRLAHIQEARQSSSASNPSLMTADDAGNHHASVATEKTQAPERKKRRISYL
jgi:tetratricopeptide (TPR) repeat protein